MVLDWGLNPGPPALEASTIPLGYRGGGSCVIVYVDIYKLPSIICGEAGELHYIIGKHRAVQTRVILDFTLKYGRQVLNPI